MKRVTLWFLATAVALVLLFGYHTSTSGPAGAHGAPGIAPVGVVTESPAPTAAAQSSPPSAVARSTPLMRTINGAPADTRYGPVQVQITVSGGRILSSDTVVHPTSERRSREINDYAVPQLNDETVQAQSASIDTVSGATYTSEGYRASLQSAIDAAHP